MKIVKPSDRRRPYVSEKTHARLRHDHALWHPDHVVAALAAPDDYENCYYCICRR